MFVRGSKGPLIDSSVCVFVCVCVFLGLLEGKVSSTLRAGFPC